jgi:endonuclease YncB( thermonuclease family)
MGGATFQFAVIRTFVARNRWDGKTRLVGGETTPGWLPQLILKLMQKIILPRFVVFTIRPLFEPVFVIRISHVRFEGEHGMRRLMIWRRRRKVALVHVSGGRTRKSTTRGRSRKIALAVTAMCAALTLQLASQFVERPVASARAVGSLAGAARVADGDTIIVADTRVRLEGIDAPEARQTCRMRDGENWNCGLAATRTLERLIGGREVRCEHRGVDIHGRVLGRCFAGATELNAEMVSQGMAWAFTRYSHEYVSYEARAKARQVGIWQGESQAAWAYRATQR